MTEMIVADVDEAAGGIVLVTHWKGGPAFRVAVPDGSEYSSKLALHFSHRPHIKQ
jgi:hypothetical protein